MLYLDSMKPTSPASSPSRFLALDYLRGFFIIVIIIDHLWRWPNLFEFISGRGELWSSAAQGFIIISGLLIGYIRGYKNRNQPLWEITKKLLKRGLTLYVWMFITTTLLVSASWFFSFRGNIAFIPIHVGDWNQLLINTLRLDYAHTLTHFLYLYAIFLALSPAAIWLLRRGYAWVVVVASCLLWLLGIGKDMEWLQWQILFFLPTIVGFYLQPLLQAHLRLTKKHQLVLAFSTIAVTLGTMIASAIIILPYTPGDYVNTIFGKDPVTLPTVLISFVWFYGLVQLFHLLLPVLERWFKWLLLPFGQRSLTAYILHTLPLMAIQFLFDSTTNIWINTLYTIACIAATRLLIAIPHINRFVPR